MRQIHSKPKILIMKKLNLKVGDQIKIRTFHYRAGYRTVVRRVVAIDSLGIQVRMFGYPNFYLRENEVLEKIEMSEQ